MEETAWVNSIVQLATAGGFGSLVWYFLVKYIPGIEDRHRLERLAVMMQLKDQHDRMETLMKEYHASLERHIKALADVCHMLESINDRLPKQ